MLLAALAVLAAAFGPAVPADTLALELNVPAYRLEVLEDGRPVRDYPVAVGTREHPTPLGAFRVDRVVWNPWWIPPPFPWAEPYSKTPPGPDNPVGRVKLCFGTYMYVHGTPEPETVGSAASHGCVRMTDEDATGLARAVHAATLPEVPAAVLDSLAADRRKTRTVRLEEPVAFSIVYRRVEARDGRVLVHPDPYRLDPRVEPGEVTAALVGAGVDRYRIDAAAVDALIARAGTATVSARVDSLLGPPGPRPTP